jgi:EpsI family protein
LESRQQNLLVWHWYYLSGHRVTNPYEAKAREVLARVFGSRRGGTAIIVYTSMADDPKPARAVLRHYLDDMEPVLESAVVFGGRGATRSGQTP